MLIRLLSLQTVKRVISRRKSDTLLHVRCWFVVIVVFFIGCAAGARICIRDASISDCNTRIDQPCSIDAAVVIVQQVFAHQHAKRWSKRIERVKLKFFWVDGVILYQNGRYNGLHFSCDEMYIAWYPNTKLSASSFAHEMGHCYSTYLFGHPGRNHKNKILWEGTIPKADAALDAAGL